MIRLWKIGNSEKGILPTKETTDKLTRFLKEDKKGETLDLVWDDMLEVEVITDGGDIIRG